MMTDDAVKEFLIESAENLDRLDVDLVELEKEPSNAERLASIFRTIHTIKGTCGFLAFSRLEALSHVGENLLARMRDGSLVLNSEIATALLAMVDTIRRILAHIETTGSEPAGDDGAIIAELTRLKDGTAVVPRDGVVDTPPVQIPSPAHVVPAEASADLPADAAAEDRRGGDERRTLDDRRSAAVADTSLRIDVGLLDKLMNLVGELVLARNQILQFTATQTDNSLNGATQRLNLVTSELQEGVMKTRMQPIGNIWGKFPRIVRDLATQIGKQVELQMEGRETDLDKTIIEAIKDPLTHIVRNSVDHGIEAPADRIRAGKPAEGRIRLRAYHEGGQINIEIADDGAGIDPAKVRATAVRRGLLSADAAQRLSDHDAISLVFQPGFSTAERVTNLSGRGVGMDVVKTNIEKIGGQVDIHSRIGEGTTLKIKIPLTLAIIPALIVADASHERYAIPQVSLLELVRLEGDQVASGIEWVDDVSFFRLRGNLLPLVHLDRELRLDTRSDGPGDAVNIVVLKADNREFGLVVDTINDTEEIVVKPLSKQLKGVSAFAGATIMGDGRVALILDVLGLAQQSGVVADLKRRAVAASPDTPAHAASGEQQTLLLFQAGTHERMAIPLESVARLEEFPATLIERSGGRPVVQYRDEILPLVTIGGPAAEDQGPRHVVVFRNDGRSVGLMVDRIIDIVSDRIVVQERLARKGVLGSAVIQGQVTELLDVTAILQTGEAGLAEAA